MCLLFEGPLFRYVLAWVCFALGVAVKQRHTHIEDLPYPRGWGWGGACLSLPTESISGTLSNPKQTVNYPPPMKGFHRGYGWSLRDWSLTK